MTAAKGSSVNAQVKLEERLRFEALIADLSSKFVNLPADEVDREIVDGERRVCELLGLDVAALWQWSDEAPGFFTLIRRASRPDTSALVEVPDGSHFVPAEAGQACASSGLMVYRFGAPLYFANATLFLEEVERLVTEAPTPVRWFVLDAQAMVDVDTTGAGVLRQAITLLAERNITVGVSRADRSFRSWLEKYELMELIDPGRFYPTNWHAAQAFRQSQGNTTAQLAQVR